MERRLSAKTFLFIFLLFESGRNGQNKKAERHKGSAITYWVVAEGYRDSGKARVLSFFVYFSRPIMEQPSSKLFIGG
jgi:hypothetical protein